MVTSSGMQMGCARPQLLLLQPYGPLLLVGGRNTVAGTNDAWLWVNSAGDGKSWTECDEFHGHDRSPDIHIMITGHALRSSVTP
jgi:hypothetical protein